MQNTALKNCVIAQGDNQYQKTASALPVPLKIKNQFLRRSLCPFISGRARLKGSLN
jgi:hypothetical protein